MATYVLPAAMSTCARPMLPAIVAAAGGSDNVGLAVILHSTTCLLATGYWLLAMVADCDDGGHIWFSILVGGKKKVKRVWSLWYTVSGKQAFQ